MGLVLDKEGFNDANAWAFSGKKINPVNAFNRSKLAPQVNGTTYVPGGDKLITDGTYPVLNKWNGFGLVPTEGNYLTIIEYLIYLFPEGKVLEHILNVLACLVQRPDEKVRQCLLITGGQGIGKSTLRVILTKILGRENVGLVNTGDWQENFNAHLCDLHVAVIEEFMSGDRLQSYNAFKPYVSDDTVKVNQKHWPVYDGRTPYFWMAFSNHERPIIIEADDRRFFVYRTPAVRESEAYYDALYEAIETESAAFMYALMQRDISNFNPDAPPPMTPDKQALIKGSFTPTKAKLSELIEGAHSKFQSDVLSLHDIRAELGIHINVTPRSLEDRNPSATLKELGGVSLGPIRIGKSKPSLWAIRNAGKWVESLPADIRKEYSNE
ncbi:primase-helicase family protein [Litorimonas sp. WD9-15]|uniref:primase-helicase family protein n=1 Tax=Litorimonas sp. WD9-15 TaxID=3418716 RepID=UPI003CFC3E00